MSFPGVKGFGGYSMKNIKRIVLASALACLAFSMAFAGTVTAADINVPTFLTGDYFKYNSQDYQSDNNGNTTYQNMTMWNNITGEASPTINGTTYSVYVVEMKGFGSQWQIADKTTIRNMYFFMNMTVYVSKSNLSTVFMYRYENITGTSAIKHGWMSISGAAWYQKAEDKYQYPVSVGKKWTSSSQDYYQAHQMTWDNTTNKITHQWGNGTETSNNAYECTGEETIGTYSCHVIKQTDPNNPSSTPSYDWISTAAGSASVQRISEYYSPTKDSYNYQYLVEGKVMGNNIGGVPVPVIPEFMVMLVPLAGIMALFIVARKMK